MRAGNTSQARIASCRSQTGPRAAPALSSSLWDWLGTLCPERDGLTQGTCEHRSTAVFHDDCISRAVGEPFWAGLPAAAGGTGVRASLRGVGRRERSLLSNAGMQVGLNAAEAGLIWCPTKPPFFPSRCILYSGCLLLSRASLILPLSPPFPFRPLANGKGMSSSLQERN